MYARELVLYLADYYRQSLINQSMLIPFAQELKHIQAYVNIEMARFGDRLHVEYQVDVPEDFRILSLLMQPLVENAVKHGILEKEEGGTVCIGASRQGEYIELFVRDDGVGIPAYQLPTLLVETREPAPEPGKQYKSVGLINVQKRLITMYGEECGLHIASTPDKGTEVTFKIPYTKEVISLEN